MRVRQAQGWQCELPPKRNLECTQQPSPSDAANWPPELRRAHASSLRHAAFTLPLKPAALQAAVQAGVRGRDPPSPCYALAVSAASDRESVAHSEIRATAAEACCAAGQQRCWHAHRGPDACTRRACTAGATRHGATRAAVATHARRARGARRSEGECVMLGAFHFRTSRWRSFAAACTMHFAAPSLHCRCACS